MERGEPGDEDCLRAMADGGGSGPAFTVLFERYADTVYNAAFRRTASWSAAEDITEVVFLELWRQRHRIEPHDGSARPWLLGVTSNRCRHWWRDRERTDRAMARLAGRDRDCAPVAGDEVADAVAARVDDERRMAGLLDAVRALPDAHQEVLMLWAWERLGYDEIAAALGVRLGTVKSRLHRARAELRAAEGTAGAPGASPVEPHGAAPATPPGAEQEGTT
jgi:RNA polymerase sigma factor (sigma-70 family)